MRDSTKVATYVLVCQAMQETIVRSTSTSVCQIHVKMVPHVLIYLRDLNASVRLDMKEIPANQVRLLFDVFFFYLQIVVIAVYCTLLN